MEKNVSHCFSVSWEDSDVILVVGNEKFHVHRLILSMNSPVFKAMFKSQFKESTANEIPLPEKKASEVLDFLKHIYFQYLEERVEITSKYRCYLTACGARLSVVCESPLLAPPSGGMPGREAGLLRLETEPNNL